MMIPKSLFITCVAMISISSSIYVAKSSKSSSSTIGFTTDLIHRDSPQSPYYNPSLSPSQRLSNLIRRSYNRLYSLNSKCEQRSPIAEVSGYYDTEYLISYQIGTPPVPSLGILDTGSDLIWTQCAPCNKCIKQRLPLFSPKNSHTYKTALCNSSSCSMVLGGSCDKSRNTCHILYLYGDGSGTVGDIATDTLTLGSTTGKPLSFPNITFGCGFNTFGEYSGVESGIVGLGSGKASLVSQLGPSIRWKFAYCLVPNTFITNTSKLHFGDNAIVSGKAVVSTPFLTKNLSTFYYVTLEGISVGNQRIENSSNDSSGSAKEGNMIVDTGTPFTMVLGDIYSKLEKALVNVVKLKRDPKPEEEYLKLCWFAKTNYGFPTIMMHFKGADVVLSRENAFYRISRDKICFAMIYGPMVYGNVAQMNFLVGYDLQKKTVSFKQRDCTKY